eukprot:31878-Amorphochlora_amoeboformis.AAC.1
MEICSLQALRRKDAFNQLELTSSYTCGKLSLCLVCRKEVRHYSTGSIKTTWIPPRSLRF